MRDISHLLCPLWSQDNVANRGTAGKRFKQTNVYFTQKHTLEGKQRGLDDQIQTLKRDLQSENYHDAEDKYRQKLVKFKVRFFKFK